LPRSSVALCRNLVGARLSMMNRLEFIQAAKDARAKARRSRHFHHLCALRVQ
jgi:hypothetical protein